MKCKQSGTKHELVEFMEVSDRMVGRVNLDKEQIADYGFNG